MLLFKLDIELPQNKTLVQGAYTYVILKDEQSFDVIRSQWDDLWVKAKGNFVQSYSYNLYCWRNIAKVFNRSLWIVIQFDRAQLCSILALTSEKKALWKLYRPLGLVANEFSAALTVEDDCYTDKISGLWAFVSSKTKNDVINLPFLKQSALLYDVIMSSKCTVLKEEVDKAYYVNLANERWEDYQKSLGGDHRRSLNRRRRNLESQGNLEFNVVSDPPDLVSVIEWLLATKKAWVIKNNKHDPWMFTEHYKNVLVAVANDDSKTNALVAFTLRLNNELISVKLASVNIAHVDRIMAAYHHSFSKESPGMILDEFVIQWCFNLNLACELGVGTEKSKQVWSRGQFVNTSNLLMTGSKWGTFGYELSQFYQRSKHFDPRK
jgi:CelD/BcsL family acetyltransferase involved in cellulose biosynthesis